MTIDEAIKFCNEKSKNIKLRTEPKTFEQIAYWLEELVMLRLDSCMIHMPERLHLVESGYNKALNDFVNFANTMPTVEEEDGTIRPMWLEEIAEQLKAGRWNEE